MPAVEHSIDVAAPSGAVFALFADYGSHAAWQTEMRSSAMLTPGPVRAGSRGFEVRRMLGRDVRVPFVVVGHEAPWRSAFRSVLGIRGRATFAALGDGRTRMTLALDGPGVPGRLIARVLARRVPEHLERFRAIAEDAGRRT